MCDSYRRAIQRAAAAAGVHQWFPNQLRDSAGTEIRKLFGIEALQTRLGHKSYKTADPDFGSEGIEDHYP